jgi:uncharacterized protein YigA (DUF484 family)
MSSDLNPEEIVQFLQENPAFFAEHSDVLADLAIPQLDDGRTISLTERQMLALRTKNRKLEHKLAELIQFGEENDLISEKLHRLFVGLIAAETFQTVIHLLNFHLRDDFAIPHVALRLWAAPTSIDELPEFAAVGEELQIFAETLTRPYCGSTSGFGTATWFGEHAFHVRSQALIALRNGGGTMGMIALGSEDLQRFYADMGTLYLERLGEAVSSALARVTRFQ